MVINGFDFSNVKVYYKDFTKPTATCDFCGSGIRYAVVFENEKGGIKTLGSTCGTNLLKGDVTNYVRRYVTVTLSKIKSLQNEKAKEKSIKSQNKIIDEYWKYTKDKNITEKLAQFDHPNRYYKSQGKSFYDYFLFMIDNGVEHSRDAQLKICRKIKKLLKNK